MDKQIVKDNPKEFNPKDLFKAAMMQLTTANRDEAITKVRRLIEKEIQTRRELDDAEKKVTKIKESLKKTEERKAKFMAGDLSVLYEKDGDSGEKKEE